MPRNADPLAVAQAQKSVVSLAFLVALNFQSGPAYVWSGVGTLQAMGLSWQGIGDLGSVSTIGEGSEVEAQGTSLTLSGIDMKILNDSLQDIVVGLPATIYLAFFDQSLNMIGAPTKVFGGLADAPEVNISTQTCSISISIESRLVRLQRGQQRRLTQVDQQLKYPSDTAFQYVETLNDVALLWG